MNKFKLILFIMVLLLGFQRGVFAADKISLQDRAISSTFKNLAKGYVAVVNMDKFKESNMLRINKLSPDSYKREYARVYEVIKELPPDLKIKYGISQEMPREQLIADIASFDKNKIYKLIDSIPDTIIVGEFKKQLNKKKPGVGKSNLAGDIQEFWNKLLAKVN